jgi:hypothetical protein
MAKYKQKSRTNQGTGLIISLISAFAKGESSFI